MNTKKIQHVFVIVTILVMTFALLCFFSACGKIEEPNGNGTQGNQNTNGNSKELSAAEIYSKVDKSVVFILISLKSGFGSGSGFFIDSNGTIVTNYHVIEDGLAGMIQMNDGSTASINKVLGFDKKSDIAILSTSAKNTTPVTISKKSVQTGEKVYAIGYPEAFTLGTSSSTFTDGMVSMTRTVNGYTYIQSTVNITHGNSGGALINTYGEVIGITTAGITYSNIDYMNLSIPIQRIDTVSRTVNESLEVVTKRNYPVYATFYSDGTKYTTQSVRYEGCAYEPTAPTKTGYSFAGWYTDSSFKTKFNFNTKLTSNVSLYAKWNIKTYNINYNLNSGTWNGSSPSKTYTINDCGKVLPIPIRSGYIFEGWKNTSGDYISKLPTSNYLGDLSLTASWVKGTEGLSFITRHSGTVYVIVTGYTGNNANVVVPKTYKGIPVECISASAFKNQTQIRSISLPNSLTSIESDAFSGCTGLTSIVIPDKVTSVNSTAFSGCINIATVSMPASIRNYIPNVKNVTITSGSAIQASAFENCTTLSSVTLPNSLVSIGNKAFYGCTNLAEIYNNSSLSLTIGATANGYVAYYANVVYKYENGGYVSTDKNGFVIKIVNNIKTLTAYIGNSSTINIPYGVQTISNNVFKDKTSIKSIDIPDTVETIGSYAFSGCSELTTVTIGNGVKSIGSNAFDNCNGLTKINVSVNNTAYASVDGILYNKEKTKFIAVPKAIKGSVAIPNGVTRIGYSVFRDCSELTELTIGASVTYIDDYAFFGCTGLTNITIPNSVTHISDKAFSNCSNLECIMVMEKNPEYASVDGILYNNNKTHIIYIPEAIHGMVNIPNSVTIIGYEAFYGRSSLTSITIPDSVTSIGTSAFYRCGNLTSIYYTGDVASWCRISGLDNIMSDSRTLYIGGKEVEGDLVIPDGVTSIGRAAFAYCSNLTSITIPDSVTSIGARAFYFCDGLTNITIPDNVTSIGFEAFRWCTGLTSITIPDSVTSIEWDTFYGCSGLTSVTIGNSVTSIGNDAFRDCTRLTSVTIPDSVTSIGNYAFSGTEWYDNQPNGLVYAGKVAYTYKGTMPDNTVIVLKESTLGIADYAFGSSKLVGITIPDSVKNIGNYAFQYCGNLSLVTIGNSVTRIGGSAFFKCSGLTSITIPDSVTSIGYQAFYGCSGLTSITIPDSVRSIGAWAFSSCTSLTSITISNSVKIIDTSTFSNCPGLISVTIPNSVTSIGSYAFQGCNGMTDITISNSVTSIGGSAFYSCTTLENIIFKGTKAEWNAISKGTFWNLYVPSTCKVHCTDGVLEI